MKKSILVGLAILTLSTSAAFAAQQSHHRHAMHARAMNAHAAVPATPAPAITGGGSSADHAQYMKNLHDSGYNPKNNFNTNGTIKTQ